MEASALPASVGLTRARLGLGASLLRLRSDEQLVSLFRAGNEDAFRVIHDRYRPRMLAYARQMLASSPADAEDAVQEIFVRAYGGLRANRRDLALRAWLYRIAHNRCVDDLRRPYPIAVEAVEDFGEATGGDPHARVEQREALRRLIADVQRLPEQQRSALLMRELAGMPYADLAGALDTSVPAVKSLLVRARVGLVQASEARDTACATIREDLVVAHDRGVRASGRSRRHMRDCAECRRFRAEVQGTSARLGLLLPALGPLAAVAKLLGIGGLGGSTGAAAGSGTTAAAGGTVAAASTTAAAAGTTGAAVGASAGTVVSASAVAGAGHVATILAATAIAAGGAIGIQHEISSGQRPPARAHRIASVAALPIAPAPAGPTHAAASTGATAPSTDGGDAAATHAPASTATGGSVDHISTLSTSAGVSGSRGATVTTETSTSGDPTLSSDPTETTSTTTATTTTSSTTTTTTPTSGTTISIGTPTTGTGTTPTPISGSGTQTDPTAPTTATPANGNPGTATGIVPTVSSATATGGSSATRRRIRLRAGRDAPRELPAGSADAR